MAVGKNSLKRVNMTDDKVVLLRNLGGNYLDVEVDKLETSCANFSEELFKSVQDYGVLEPILLAEVDEKLVVITGNQRINVCKKLKILKIPARVLKVDMSKAKFLINELNSFKKFSEIPQEKECINREKKKDIPFYLL